MDRFPVIGGSIAEIGSYSNKSPIGHHPLLHPKRLDSIHSLPQTFARHGQ
jgi:hypothetical protein